MYKTLVDSSIPPIDLANNIRLTKEHKVYNKGLKQSIALNRNASQSYSASPATQDHTVLPAI